MPRLGRKQLRRHPTPWRGTARRRSFPRDHVSGAGPKTLEMGSKHCYHTACPVPVGIIKAIEIEAGLALPKDAAIELSKSE